MNIPQNIINAIKEMFMCNNFKEHMACYQYFYHDLTECTFVIFSENEGNKLPEVLCTNYDNDFAIINIGCANQYYAINNIIFKEMISSGKSDFYIDVCVDLDTQAVSYLKNIFIEYNQVPDYNKIKSLIEYLQLPQVNYSCIPYLVENAGKKNISKIDCYRNIKSYMLFKAFDYSGFLQNGKCEYNREEVDILLDIDGLYNDMFSQKFQEAYSYSYNMQRALYVLLLKAVCIEFTNSKKASYNKIMELLDFVNEELGFYAERELEVCYCYLKHDERIKKFFKRVQKNNKDILNTINGMAWDLTHIRIIEQQCMAKPTEQVEFAIHVLLTFDNGLKEILQINPVEQIAFYQGASIPKLKYRWLDSISGAAEKMDLERNKRLHTFETVNINELSAMVENELLSLCNKI